MWCRATAQQQEGSVMYEFNKGFHRTLRVLNCARSQVRLQRIPSFKFWGLSLQETGRFSPTSPAFGRELVLIPHSALVQAAPTQMKSHDCYADIRKNNHQARTSSERSLTSLTVNDNSDNRHNNTKDIINLE